MKIRKATCGDMDRILCITAHARQYFRENGIPQWQGDYPGEGDFSRDIELGRLYVADENGEAVGFYCYDNGGDENYNEIFEGSFSSNEPYAAIHRIAVDERLKGKGVAGKMVNHALSIALSEGFSYVRGDTHRLNISMQKMLTKNGFRKCGIIYLDGIKSPESERFAFEIKIK